MSPEQMDHIRQAARDILDAAEFGWWYAGGQIDAHKVAWAQWILWHAPKVWPELITANECFTEIVL